MNNDQANFLGGIFAGLICTICLWAVCANIVESEKTLNGYLTFKGVRYTVTEYDRLDVPPKPEAK